MSSRDFNRTLNARSHRAISTLVAGVLGLVAPRSAGRYLAARSHLYRMMERGYSAGDLRGPDSGWRPVNRSADAEIRMDGKTVLARARDLHRNNPVIKGAIGKIVNNVIFQGIKPQATLAKSDGSPDRDLNTALETAWAKWARFAYSRGGRSIYALQALGLSHTLVDGEILYREMVKKGVKGVPLRLDILESDYLFDFLEGTQPDGIMIKRGIEFDDLGEPVAYHLYQSHPGDYTAWRPGAMYNTVRIPVAQIRHLFTMDRASQTRGISLLAPLAMRAYDLDEYADYEMIAAKLAAAFSVFIVSPDANLGGDLTGTRNADGTVAGSKQYIEPGRIDRLNVGEDIKFAQHDRPGTTFDPFVTSTQRNMSTGLGMSYENFSGDYRGSSFSSARQALLEERRGYQVLQQFVIDQFCGWTWEKFLDFAVLSGTVRIPRYASRREDIIAAVKWNSPGWPWIDPLKDAKGSEARIAQGISSRTREAAAQGADFEEVVAELAREKEILIEAGLAKEAEFGVQATIGKDTTPATAPAQPAAAPGDAASAADANADGNGAANGAAKETANAA